MAKHAIVLGGSIAGLVAARALRESFERVTVVERDALAPNPALRAGVSQAKHIHILLARGLEVLRDLFPSLAAELDRAGVPEVDWIDECWSFTGNSWAARSPSTLVVRMATREHWEWQLRQQIARDASVHLLTEHEATGFRTSGDRIDGVTLRPRREASGRCSELRGELVVDTLGRASQTPDWLHELGYPRPEEIVVDAKVGYASRRYRAPARPERGWKVLWVQGGSMNRSGALAYVENAQWIVTLVGVGGDYPPTDEHGFLAFARSLPSPTLGDAIASAEPLSPIAGHRRTASRLRRYDRMQRWPEGLIALGDSVCTFNPAYGQGMTTAALGAAALRDCLRRHQLRGIGPIFQNALYRAIQPAWLLAVGEDLRHPATTGAALEPGARAMQWYLGQLVRQMADPVLRRAFVEVMHMRRSPSSLIRPELMARVLRGRLGATFLTGRS